MNQPIRGRNATSADASASVHGSVPNSLRGSMIVVVAAVGIRPRDQHGSRIDDRLDGAGQRNDRPAAITPEQRHVDLGKLPVFLENQVKGNYKVYLDPGDYGGDMIIKFNLNYDADPEIGKWFNTADFRRALALGIDRDQINETFWLGTGTPSSVVPADNNKYNPGPQYRKLWATLDVKKANEMLDKIGLAKKDAQGYRLRSDGKGAVVHLRDTLR